MRADSTRGYAPGEAPSRTDETGRRRPRAPRVPWERVRNRRSRRPRPDDAPGGQAVPTLVSRGV